MRSTPPRPASPPTPSARPGGGAGALPPRAVLALALGALALLGWLVYMPGLHGGFVFDDFSNNVDQPALAPQALSAHFWQAVWAGRAGPFSRALSMLSFAWQIRVWGMQPLPMKVFNVLLHLLNAGLVAWLSLRVLEWVDAREREQRPGPAPDWVLAPRVLAVLVAGAWLLAPIQLTAVLYVVQREESLAATFVLLGLLGYWHGRMLLREAVRAGRSQRRAWAWIWAGLLGGTVLAALAKETGIMLPAYAAVLEWVVLRADVGAPATGPAGRAARCSLLGVYALLLVLPGLLGLAWLLPGVLSGAAYAQRPFTLAQRLLTEGRVLVDYLHWIVLPDPGTLSLYHDDLVASSSWLHPWTTAPSWLALAALLAAGLGLRRRRPVVSLGILWFFAGHSLVSTFVPLDLVYEHRNYLPCWGVFLAAFGLLGTWRAREPGHWRTVAGVLCVGLLALYAGFTAIRAQIWGNPLRLAYFEASAHPRSPRAVYDLGRVLYLIAPKVDSPQFRQARRAMLQASEIPGADLQAVQALVFMQAKQGLPVPAALWEQLRAKVSGQQLGVENVGALYSLVQCAVDKVCRYQPADLRRLGELLDAGVRAHPDDGEMITLRANFEANVSHRFPRAYADMLRAVALDPGNFAYWKNLVQLQIAGRQLSQAALGLERLRELDPFGLHREQRQLLRRQWQAARVAQAAQSARQPEGAR